MTSNKTPYVIPQLDLEYVVETQLNQHWPIECKHTEYVNQIYDLKYMNHASNSWNECISSWQIIIFYLNTE